MNKVPQLYTLRRKAAFIAGALDDVADLLMPDAPSSNVNAVHILKDAAQTARYISAQLDLAAIALEGETR